MTDDEIKQLLSIVDTFLDGEILKEKLDEICKLAIKALEQTDNIEESNFSTKQYKADIQVAYDCGYNSGYAQAMMDIAESEESEMTNEEAINTLNSLKNYYNDKNEDSYVGFDDEDNEALDLAIKALEQQGCVWEIAYERGKVEVLDKIRAEIERKAHSGQWSDATIYGMLKAVAIIYKYREGGAE